MAESAVNCRFRIRTFFGHDLDVQCQCKMRGFGREVQTLEADSVQHPNPQPQNPTARTFANLEPGFLQRAPEGPHVWASVGCCGGCESEIARGPASSSAHADPKLLAE